MEGDFTYNSTMYKYKGLKFSIISILGSFHQADVCSSVHSSDTFGFNSLFDAKNCVSVAQYTNTRKVLQYPAVKNNTVPHFLSISTLTTYGRPS